MRGWVAIYTFGLPRPMRARRRDEIAADLADELADAIRRGTSRQLFRRRISLLLRGIPDDLTWRFIDAPAFAAAYRRPAVWVPLSRWSLMLSAVVAIGAAGALAIVTVPIVTGQATPDAWTGWGPLGFAIGCAGVLAGILASVPWPRRGALVLLAGAVVGLVAAPLLWGPWLLASVAVGVRCYEAAVPGDPGPVDLVIRRPRP